MATVLEARRSLARFLHVRSAAGPTFTHDGQEVAYLTNVTGVSQVWTVPSAGGRPEQRSFHAERVMEVRGDPVNDRLVFVMDLGGDEHGQLHLLCEGGAVEVALTESPEVIHLLGCFSDDGSHLAYAANDCDPAAFDVFVRPVGPRGEGTPRRLLRSSGMTYPVCFSPDGRSLLVEEARSSFDQDLHLVDLETGERRLLTPRKTGEAVRHTGAVFTRDGKHLYLRSDRGDDFVRLLRLRLDDGAFQVVDEGGADVELLAGSHHGEGLIYVRNVAGISEVHHLDPETGADTVIEDLPAGVVTGVALSVEGRRAALAVSADDRPSDLHLVALPDGAPRQLTFSSLAGIPQDALVPGTPERFPTFDDRQIPGFLYRPEGEAKPPCVVYVHGGPEGQFRPEFNPVVQYLVNRGYAVFAPNVRGSVGYGKGFAALDDVRLRLDSVKDLEACGRWLAARDDVDGARLAVMGGSYGGFMVLSTLVEAPDLWAAGVDFVGIANLVTFLEHTGPWRRKLREAEYGSLKDDRDFLTQVSPIHRADRIAAPLMVIHGARDPRVPVSEAEQIVAALKAKGQPVTYLRFEDEGHGIVRLANKLAAWPAVADFLDTHLRG